MERKLPVYLVLDTSGSMSGEPIAAVENGVQTMVNALRQNPQALDTVWLSVITFDSSAKQAVPLTEVAAFQMPTLQASGLTSLGEALKLVAKRIDAEVTKTTKERKGDWKPLVFIMTDGGPTDDWQKGLAEFRKAKVGMVIACAAGQSADTDVLKQITECVMQLDTADSNTIIAFFKWVTDSLGVCSQKVDGGAEVGGMGELPPPPIDRGLSIV